MKINLTYPEIGEWRSWFAWYPVEIDKRLVWFEPVERAITGYDFDGSAFFKYRMPKNAVDTGLDQA